ncbi:hypothetical protein, partial [Chamaesiphon sp. VAR_48_metabat_403]|uniref:hypothetical protein n=1 Tax=Chamaesiphon sp. VAR_48_metabat_403 TaxID=2964700 RepID=UPI00286E58DA
GRSIAAPVGNVTQLVIDRGQLYNLIILRFWESIGDWFRIFVLRCLRVRCRTTHRLTRTQMHVEDNTISSSLTQLNADILTGDLE